MKIFHIKRLRQIPLASIYILGILGIVGSGGGGIDFDLGCAADGFLDDCVDPPPPPPTPPPPGSGFNRKVTLVAPALDGSDDVYVAGFFTWYESFRAFRIARLNNDGSFDTSFVTGTGFNAFPETIAPATDGSGDVYAGGFALWNYNGTDIFNIVRLNLDGTFDSTFDTGTGFTNGTGFNNSVYIIVPASDGSGDVYVGGNFTRYNGTDVGSGLIRLNNDGSIDAVFDTGLTGFDNSVSVIAVATDGSGDVYVGGGFTDYNGTGTKGIVRINSDGSLDTDFTAGAEFDSVIEIITLATDGSGDIYANTKSKNQIARLNDDGSLDTGFDTGSGFILNTFTDINSIAVATDGSNDIYVGGDLLLYNSLQVDDLVRLNSQGDLVR